MRRPVLQAPKRSPIVYIKPPLPPPPVAVLLILFLPFSCRSPRALARFPSGIARPLGRSPPPAPCFGQFRTFLAFSSRETVSRRNIHKTGPFRTIREGGGGPSFSGCFGAVSTSRFPGPLPPSTGSCRLHHRRSIRFLVSSPRRVNQARQLACAFNARFQNKKKHHHGARCLGNDRVSGDGPAVPCRELCAYAPRTLHSIRFSVRERNRSRSRKGESGHRSEWSMRLISDRRNLKIELIEIKEIQRSRFDSLERRSSSCVCREDDSAGGGGGGKRGRNARKRVPSKHRQGLSSTEGPFNVGAFTSLNAIFSVKFPSE